MNSFILILVLLFLCFQTVESKTVYVLRQIFTPIILTHNNSSLPTPPLPPSKVTGRRRAAGGQGGLRCVRAVLITQNRIARPSWLGKNNGIGYVSILMGKRGASLSSRGKRPLFDDGRGGWVEEGLTGGGAFRAIASPWQRRGWLTYCQ